MIDQTIHRQIINETPAASASPAWKKPLTLMAMGIVLIGLWLTSRVSYLLFHSLVEVFAVLVAWGMFIVAWNTRRFMRPRLTSCSWGWPFWG